MRKKVFVSDETLKERTITRCKTHLNPTNLVLHEIDQKTIRNLSLSLLHAFQQRGLGRFETRHARAFQARAEHFQAQADVPQIPDVLRVDREGLTALSRSELVFLGVGARFGFGFLLLHEEARGEAVRVHEVDVFGVFEAFEGSLAEVFDFEALGGEGAEFAADGFGE